MDWGRKWLVDFKAGKTQLVSFVRSNNTGAIDVKMDGSFLEKKSSFKMLGLTFSSRSGWGSYIISIAKTASKKNWSLDLFCEVSFSRGSPISQLVPLPYSQGRSTHYSDRLHDFSVTILWCYKDVYVNSLFPRTARLWISLPIECFPLTCDLNSFMSRINRYLLTVGSF